MSSSIPSHVTSVEMSVSYTSNTNASMKPSNNSSQLSVSTPTCLMSSSGMSGLLNSRNLVQDEKLAVATLATLQSGSASNLIKQDLKFIIQSRRRAEGKSEIQVEFKKPVKDELTSEEVVKRARRRELNRLAARRSREKGQRKKDRLVEEICHLQSQNRELIHILGSLSDERDSIIEALKQHMKECSEHTATRDAATGLSQNVLEKLGFLDRDQMPQIVKKEPFTATSHLYICTSSDVKPMARCHSPPLQRAKTTHSMTFSSCPSSPVVIGFSGKPLVLEEKLQATQAATILHNISSMNSRPSSPLPPSSIISSPIIASGKSHLGPQISSEDDQRLLPPPPHQITHRHRNPSHAFEQDYSHRSPDGDPRDYNFTRPTSPVTRQPRVLLERSFSFPSSHRETRVDLSPGMCFTSSSTDSEGLDASRETTRSSLHCKSEEQEAPLDLVVRNKSSYLRKEMSLPVSRDERSPGRRRSVDDGMYANFREPLNLSCKSATSLSYPNLPQESSHSKI